MTVPSIFWFRRDLRLGDQPVLAAAAAEGPVAGVFVVDERLYGPSGAARQAFLVDSLNALDHSMGGALVIRTGRPADVIADLAEEIGASEVHATCDFGPYGRERDREVAASLAQRGARLALADSPYAVAPGSILSGGGTPYKVFTPFFRAWKAHGWRAPIDARPVSWVEAPSDGPPTAPDLDYKLPVAGEEAALARLEEFCDESVFGYRERRDEPGCDGTSRLSPYLKWGAVHPRQILARLGPDPSEDVFRSEIAWREFYADVLFNRPDSARSAYVAKMAAMVYDTGPVADERFEAWCQGQTGYPIVDAGMRQLLATGWMHNRVRMIVASFLVKDLHIDWFRGARWFMDQLIDGDLASNNHGWQWVAGTGTDASPYFRVFNPTSQGKKFDPDGIYVRQWIPEIAHLGNKVIHEPWADPHGAPAAYPLPIVDHAAERIESLDRYDQLKAGWS